ncbi:MAG: tetratricopeptide repeat protein [Victivallaceae bacterium]
MTYPIRPRKPRSKRLKYLVTGFSAAAALAVIAVFSYYALKDQRRVKKYRQALETYDKGDFNHAEKQLIECFSSDPNNEAVLVKLAELNEKEKRYRNAAFYYRSASNLNPFDTRLLDGRLRALDSGRLYAELISDLEKLPPAKRAPYTELLIHAKLTRGEKEQARQLLEALPPDRRNSDRIRFDSFVLNSEDAKKKPSEAEIDAGLANFTKSADAGVAFSALFMQFLRRSAAGNLQGAEEALVRAAELNPECALYLLGDLYFETGRYAEACVTYRKALQSNLPTASAVRYAEALFEGGRKNEIKDLAKAFQRGSKEILRTGNYLEAMTSYLDGHYRLTADKLKTLDNSFRSPTALMLMLDTGIRTDNAAMVAGVLREMRNMPKFRERMKDIGQSVMPMLARLYSSRRIAEAAPVADLLYSQRNPDLLLTRIRLLDRSETGMLTYDEVAFALEKFPSDPVILSIAARRALRNGDFKEMLELTRRNLAGGNRELETKLQEVTALEKLGRIDEAAAKLAALRAAAPDQLELFKRQLSFAIRHDRLELLHTLYREAAGSPQPPIRELAFLPEAELDFRAGKTAEGVALLTARPATEVLKVADPENWELLYLIALRLGSADAIDPAAAIYEKLKVVLPDPSMARLNLSELYAARGRKAEALSEAQDVWMHNHNLPAAREAYAMRLAESGKYEDALPIFREFNRRHQETTRLAEARKMSLEKLIPPAFNAGKLDDCLEYCAELLRDDPANPIALEFRKKIAIVKENKG